jgi:hypothetical protein
MVRHNGLGWIRPLSYADFPVPQFLNQHGSFLGTDGNLAKREKEKSIWIRKYFTSIFTSSGSVNYKKVWTFNRYRQQIFKFSKDP